MTPCKERLLACDLLSVTSCILYYNSKSQRRKRDYICIETTSTNYCINSDKNVTPLLWVSQMFIWICSYGPNRMTVYRAYEKYTVREETRTDGTWNLLTGHVHTPCTTREDREKDMTRNLYR